MKLQKNNLNIHTTWFGATSDIAFLLIIFFIISTTFAYSNSILFKNQKLKKYISSKDKIHIIKLIGNNSVIINDKTYSINNLSTILKIKNKYIIESDKTAIYQEFVNLIDTLLKNNINTFEIK